MPRAVLNRPPRRLRPLLDVGPRPYEARAEAGDGLRKVFVPPAPAVHRRGLLDAEPTSARRGQDRPHVPRVGQSRSLPWKRRPESLALLGALKRPDRGFDAVVIGEPARAFSGQQFGDTFPLFTHYGVELWCSEVGGKVDPASDAHDMLMIMYGGMSKAERGRIKVRVRSAMAAQAQHEGRFLGGDPHSATSWLTPASTPTQARPLTGSGCTASSPTRRPRPWSLGSSAST